MTLWILKYHFSTMTKMSLVLRMKLPPRRLWIIERFFNAARNVAIKREVASRGEIIEDVIYGKASSPDSDAVQAVSQLVVRPWAIWLSLLGTDASPTTRVFFGWFGPRGLATALFALLVVDQLDHALGESVLHLAVNAVWISAVFLGLTAAPGAKLYARRMNAQAPRAEMMPVEHSSEVFAAHARHQN